MLLVDYDLNCKLFLICYCILWFLKFLFYFLSVHTQHNKYTPLHLMNIRSSHLFTFQIINAHEIKWMFALC